MILLSVVFFSYLPFRYVKGVRSDATQRRLTPTTRNFLSVRGWSNGATTVKHRGPKSDFDMKMRRRWGANLAHGPLVTPRLCLKNPPAKAPSTREFFPSVGE
jgi:hypothetical protein